MQSSGVSAEKKQKKRVMVEQKLWFFDMYGVVLTLSFLYAQLTIVFILYSHFYHITYSILFFIQIKEVVYLKPIRVQDFSEAQLELMHELDYRLHPCSASTFINMICSFLKQEFDQVDKEYILKKGDIRSTEELVSFMATFQVEHQVHR